MNAVKKVLIGLFLLFFGYGVAQQLSWEGSAELQLSEEASWQPLEDGNMLEVNARVRTFQGDVTVQLADNQVIRLAADSVLLRRSRDYVLEQGKAFVHAEGDGITFQLAGPVRVTGEARFDAQDAQARVAVINGSARITHLGRVVNLEPNQQLLVPADEEPEVTTFFETDPWYLNLVPVGEGYGKVIGLFNIAEVRSNDSDWQLTQVDSAVSPGMYARTGDSSWLELRFDNNNLVRLQEGTEISLTQVTDFDGSGRRSVIALQQGKVWVVVESDGQSFEVETRGLVAGVRGTKFRVDAPEADAPALIKTFEGEVVGVQGFEAIPVPVGQQFDTERGLEALVVDEIDSFNLERDRLITAPELTVTPVSTLSSDTVLTLTGKTEPGTTVTVANNAEITETGTFSREVPLKPGLNIIALSASNQGSIPAHYAAPVIRSGYDVLHAVATPEWRLTNALSITGVASANATVTVSTDAASKTVTAGADGRFHVRLFAPDDAYEVLIQAQDTLGNYSEQRLSVQR